LLKAFTWFFLLTVPASRNAKPACIERIITAPISKNKTFEEFIAVLLSKTWQKSLLRRAATKSANTVSR
jgi:hypothetical protein